MPIGGVSLRQRRLVAMCPNHWQNKDMSSHEHGFSCFENSSEVLIDVSLSVYCMRIITCDFCMETAWYHGLLVPFSSPLSLRSGPIHFVTEQMRWSLLSMALTCP